VNQANSGRLPVNSLTGNEYRKLDIAVPVRAFTVTGNNGYHKRVHTRATPNSRMVMRVACLIARSAGIHNTLRRELRSE